jgi:hypothetical protein
MISRSSVGFFPLKMGVITPLFNVEALNAGISIQDIFLEVFICLKIP